jgi:hypothetical protein
MDATQCTKMLYECETGSTVAVQTRSKYRKRGTAFCCRPVCLPCVKNRARNEGASNTPQSIASSRPAESGVVLGSGASEQGIWSRSCAGRQQFHCWRGSKRVTAVSSVVSVWPSHYGVKAGQKARNSIARSIRIDSCSAWLGSFNFSNELSKHPSSCLNEPAREPAREPNEPKFLALNFY